MGRETWEDLKKRARSDEVAIILCQTVEELDEASAGSRVRECTGCGTQIWVAASSLTLMLHMDAVPVCFDCALQLGPVPAPGERIGQIRTMPLDWWNHI